VSEGSIAADQAAAEFDAQVRELNAAIDAACEVEDFEKADELETKLKGLMGSSTSNA
jgi:protein-arginine kinase activator protein McsA